MLDLLYLPTGLILIGLVRGSYQAYQAGNPVLGTNALASAVAVVIPLVIDLAAEPLTGIDITIGPVLPLWIAIAGALHSIGMTTVYERIWWWDHVTHTISAALIGAIVYGALVAIDADPGTASLDWSTIAGLTVGITLLAGVLWELVELAGRDVAAMLDREPMLVPYGRMDTMLDLIFDLLGALVIVLLDLRVFVSLAEQSPSTALDVLWWLTVSMAVAVLGLGMALAWFHHGPR